MSFPIINRLHSVLTKSPIFDRFGSGLLVAGLFSLMMTGSALAAPIHVVSGSQYYQPFEGTSMFEGGVQVATGETQVNGPNAKIQTDKSGKPDTAVFTKGATMVQKNGDNTQTVQAQNLQMGLKNQGFSASGKVTTQMGGKGAGNVSIQSDSQVFDQVNGLMRATGHVVVKKDDLLVNSPEALIFMAQAGGGAEKVVFLKGAKLVQGEQEMNAVTITVNLKSGDIFAEKNAKSTVMGKNSQGQPTKIKVDSQLQELHKDTGMLMANGNAVIDYDDYLAKGPKAVFYKKNNELDHIILTGRAQIEDEARRVVGDVVTITVTPRQFDAKGNVNTFIKAKNEKAAAPTPSGKQPAKASNGKSPSGSKASASTAVPAATQSPTSKAIDDELLIEKTLKDSDKK